MEKIRAVEANLRPYSNGLAFIAEVQVGLLDDNEIL
jgi:hypothetical protein